MNDLLGLSFDSSASPSIRIEDCQEKPESSRVGWGFTWYPGNGNGVATVKDPVPTHDNPLSSILRDWERFRSTHTIHKREKGNPSRFRLQ